MAVNGKLFYVDSTYTAPPVVLINAGDDGTDLLRAVYPSEDGGAEIVACGSVSYAYSNSVVMSESSCRVAEFCFTEFCYGEGEFKYEVSTVRRDPAYDSTKTSSSMIVFGGSVHDWDNLSDGRYKVIEFAPGGEWFDTVKQGVAESFDLAVKETSTAGSVTVVLHDPASHEAKEINQSTGSGGSNYRNYVARGGVVVDFDGAEGRSCRVSSYGAPPETECIASKIYAPWRVDVDVWSHRIMMFPAVAAGAKITFPTTVKLKYSADYFAGPGSFALTGEELLSCITPSCSTRYSYEYQAVKMTSTGREIIIPMPVEAYRLDAWCNDIGGLACWNFIKDNSLISAGGAVKIVVPEDISSYVEGTTTLTITVPDSRVVALVPCMASIYAAVRDDLCNWGSGGCGIRTTTVTCYLDVPGVMGGVVCEECDSYTSMGSLSISADVVVCTSFDEAAP